VQLDINEEIIGKNLSGVSYLSDEWMIDSLKYSQIEMWFLTGPNTKQAARNANENWQSRRKKGIMNLYTYSYICNQMELRVQNAWFKPMITNVWLFLRSL